MIIIKPNTLRGSQKLICILLWMVLLMVPLTRVTLTNVYSISHDKGYHNKVKLTKWCVSMNVKTKKNYHVNKRKKPYKIKSKIKHIHKDNCIRVYCIKYWSRIQMVKVHFKKISLQPKIKSWSFPTRQNFNVLVLESCALNANIVHKGQSQKSLTMQQTMLCVLGTELGNVLCML